MTNEENTQNVDVAEATGQTKASPVPANRVENTVTRADQPNFSSPFTLMRHFAEDMENMLTDFGFDRDFPRMNFFEANQFGFNDNDFFNSYTPPVEVVESDGKLIVRTDLPGLEKDDINVEVRDKLLTIEGERKNESEEKGENFYRSERSYGSFYRQIPLPESVKTEDAKATFKNGVLEVTLAAPKLESKGTRLEITDDITETKTAATG